MTEQHDWIYNVHFNNVLKYEETKKREKLRAETFIFTYLLKNKDKGKIDSFLIYKNGFFNGLSMFLNEISEITDKGLIKITKSNNYFVKIVLTPEGKSYALKNNFHKNNYIHLSFLNRIKLQIIKPVINEIKRLNPVWKSILAIIISSIGGFICYLIIEYYKTL